MRVVECIPEPEVHINSNFLYNVCLTDFGQAQNSLLVTTWGAQMRITTWGAQMRTASY